MYKRQVKPDGLYPAGKQGIFAQDLGTVDEKAAQLFIPLDQAQLSAAQHSHVTALTLQIVGRSIEQCHVGALALLDLVVDHRHHAALVLGGGGGVFNAGFAAHQPVSYTHLDVYKRQPRRTSSKTI